MWRKALVIGLVLIAMGMVVGGAVGHESFVVWKITHSEKMGAVTIGGGLAMGTALIKAGIVATLGAATGWFLGVVIVGV
ncbi:hypothetical protein [Thermococcus barophilus]|uniref:Uncharacterized protein n=1 Tax=Thermococcus barophilus (strain DSM 11836 / MP) TaxID=391623 RepID=F0LKA8_THEBM|nr:hypothetical protein [Thermococcus barophilus]ADT83566.1 hypothetical protein TERMP_00589 [Thermococcus barophilus MP]